MFTHLNFSGKLNNNLTPRRIKVKRVLLINQGKTENLGDKAIDITFRNLLKENNCLVDSAGFAQTNEQSMSSMTINTKFNIRSYIKKLTPDLFIWFFKYRKNIMKEFNSITDGKKYDLVIIGGGQLIKTKGVFVYTLLTWYNILSRKFNCPIIISGVGADTSYSLLEKAIYKKLLPKFDSIYVRDNKSQRILKDQYNITAEYIPDIVFAFGKYQPMKVDYKKNSLLVMIYDFKALKKHFGTEYNKEEYYNAWINLIEENIEPDLEIILGYTSIGDKMETINFSKYLQKHTDFKFKVASTNDMESYIEILKITKKLISGRMHGMLLGMNYDCEIVPFVVSPKIETFKKEWINTSIDKRDVIKEIDFKIKEILN